MSTALESKRIFLANAVENEKEDVKSPFTMLIILISGMAMIRLSTT